MKSKCIEYWMSGLLLVAVSVAMLVALPMSYPVEKGSVNRFVVAIDAGHGGYDPGKVSKAGTKEKDLNLIYAKQIKQILNESGIDVILTRSEDVALDNTKARDMRKRCEIIEENNAALTVSLHMNSYKDSRVYGAQVFYYKHSSGGKELAACIQDSIKSKFSDNKRACKENDNYYMLLHTSNPTVIVECGFLSNPGDEKNLTDEKYRKDLCRAIADGIIAYQKSR